MWKFKLRRNSDGETKSFKFEKGKFTDYKDLNTFSGEMSLFLDSIENLNDKTVIYLEQTISIQLEIFNGKTFVFSDFNERLYRSIKKVNTIINLTTNEHINSSEKQVIIESSIIFMVTALDSFVKDCVNYFSSYRESLINNGADVVFRKTINEKLKYFNSPKIKNIKGLLRDLNLHPEIFDPYESSQIDLLVETRNKLAHGGKVNIELTDTLIREFSDSTYEIMQFLSSNIYKKMAQNRELKAFSFARQNTIGIDSVWNLLPLFIEEVQLN